MSLPKKAINGFIDAFNVAKAKAKLSKDNISGRLFPSRTTRNDSKSNFRADQGAPHTEDPDTFSVNVQANSNASNSSVRKYAQKNPHKELFSFDMTKDDEEEDVRKRMREAAEKEGYL